LSIAPVDPDPQKITTWSSPAPTADAITCRACSRSTVVRRPVADVSECVFAYQGSTSVRR
jgi:hypothetical protein